LDASFELDGATNLFATLKKKSNEYCFMSQALDFVVQTSAKVERYFCCISQLSTVIFGFGLLYHLF